MELLGLFRLRGNRGAHTRSRAGEPRLLLLPGRQPLRANGQFFLKRLEAVVSCREFLPGRLVDLLRFDDLAFEHLHRGGLDFQLILHLPQHLFFEAQSSGDVRETVA